MEVTDAVHEFQKSGLTLKMFSKKNEKKCVFLKNIYKKMFFLSIQKNMFRQNDSFGLKFSGQSKKWVEIVNRIGYLHKSTLD